MELYKKHRPTSLNDIVGQDAACSMLSKMIEQESVPHAILFTGPSGTGKTTLARILKTHIQCHDNDFHEINSADFRGVDSIREIRSRISLSPTRGPCKAWLIDECHKLTGDAQNAFLKMLEDTPKHVFFFLATTDPGKLLPTIRTRCTEIACKSLTPKQIQTMVNMVSKQEGKKLCEEVCDRLAELAEGSARKALVLLHQILDISDEEEQLECLQSSDTRQQAIEIARALMNPKTQWPQMAALLKTVEDEPESIRHLVLAYATAVLLKSPNSRAFQIIQSFRDDWYSCKKAGLVASCFEVVGITRSR